MSESEPETMTTIALIETQHGVHVRHHRVELFPFIVGLADRLGWEARWWRVHVPEGFMHRGDRYVVGLPEAETARLAERLAAFAPDVVVCHDRPDDDLASAVRAALPSCRIVDLTGRVLLPEDAAAEPPGADGRGRERREVHPHVTVADIQRLLTGAVLDTESIDPSAFLLDAVEPSFRHVTLGDDAPASQQPVRLAVEVTCAYQRPLARSPVYADLDSEIVRRHLGCSFCLTAHAPSLPSPGRPMLETPSVDLVIRQILAHQAAEPATGARPEYVFEETHFHRQLDLFFEAVLDIDIRPSVFWLTLRADMLLALRPRLDELLPRLQDAGHALRLLSIGAESFSEAENERFHKGVTLERLWACHDMITELEARFQDTFRCPDDGHFVGILFTPWTTPSDLRANLKAARRLGPGWLKQMLGSRLQLWEDAPITALAARDGLLAEPGGGVDDDAAVCQMNPDDRELPWRFEDQRVETIRSLLIRLDPVPETVMLDRDNDPLLTEIRERRAKLPQTLRDDYVALAAAVLEAVDELGADASTSDIFSLIAAAEATASCGAATTIERDDGAQNAGGSARRALLLLECVTNERWVYDARYFPFIKGCAEELGFATEWICFGSRITMEKSGYSDVEQFVDLGPEELDRLRDRVDALRPSHVVISHQISATALACLRRGNPDIEILSVSGHRPTGGVEWLHDVCDRIVEAPRTDDSYTKERAVGILASASGHVWQYGRTDWLLTWLGETPDTSSRFGRYLVGTIRPSYDALIGNEKARRYKPHLLICGGVTCDHFKPVASNERFSGVDLSGCTHTTGCSYCTWYRGPTSNLRDDPVLHAEQQLRRVLETAGEDGRFQGIFDMLDVRLFKHIDRFFEMVLSLELPPAIFCFEPRLDRFVDVAEKLESILPSLAHAGHCIYLFRMGAENLVEEENIVFNKYVTLESIDFGMDRMEELARRYPGTFEHDPTWGYINCSPWTTLEMFELGVDRAIQRRFEPTGVWLYTPLLMYRGSPIALLAEKEGFILDEYDDISLLYNPAVNQIPFEGLRPWRFGDERTGIAFALIVRFCAAALRHKYSDNLFDDDALYARLLARESELGAFARPDLFAKLAIGSVKSARAEDDKAELLDSALDAYASAVGELPGFVPRFSGGAGRYHEITSFSDEDDGSTNEMTSDLPAEASGGATSASSAAAERPDDNAAERLDFLLDAVRDRYINRFGSIRPLTVAAPMSRSHIDVSISVGGHPYDLRLYDRQAKAEFFFQTDRFSVVHTNDIEQHSPPEIEQLRRFFDVFGKAVAAYAPDLLPR